MQTKNAVIGQRAYALINTTGQTGFDAVPSRWMTVELVAVGVDTYQIGPVGFGKAEGVDDAYVRKQFPRSGRKFVVRVVEAGEGEPSYYRVKSGEAKYFIVGPHQVHDLAGYQQATAKQAEQRAAKEAEAERRRVRYEAEKLAGQRRRFEELKASEALTEHTAGVIWALIVDGKLDI